MTSNDSDDLSRVAGIERPSPRLLTYYALASLLSGPAFPIVFAVMYVRFRTLRYRFDDEGISWSRGVLFRREIHLTYSRIQDIHLASNIVERYLGIARIQIQTASGKAGAEMTIEGLEEHVLVRDVIYGRMRGLRGGTGRTGERREPGSAPVDGGVAEALDEIAAALRELRGYLASRRDAGNGPT